MKASSLRLYLLRHAEAVPSQRDDLSRPLTPGGRLEAETIAQWFSSRDLRPDVVLHSPARRILETLAALKQAMPKLSCVEKRELYNASAGDLYEAIKAAPESAVSLMLIGHNPGIQTLCGMLAGEAEPSVLDAARNGFAPATLAMFDCPVQAWRDLMPRDNRLVDFFVPGTL